LNKNHQPNVGKRFEDALLAPTTSVPLEAIEHVRKMRGGSPPQLLRCSDGQYYVVKFANNPQGSRILANEFLCAHLAARLGLPVLGARVINVREKFIHYSEQMTIERPHGRVPCKPGLCFGSRHPGTMSIDLLPDQYWNELENISDFAGMLVFDLWTSNTDIRQVVFFKESSEEFMGKLWLR